MKLNDTMEKILEQIQQPLWEHWYIKDKLGSGAYSCVYRVEAQRSRTRINTAALKIQPITANGREFINESDKRAYIERQKARVDREAEIMLELRRFPNIVFYEDEDVRELIINGKFEGYYSLLRMELLTAVVDLIHKRTFDFSEKNIVKLACDIGKGIAGAHSVGVIHRDIKPDNFFVDDYDTYKIGDFNVAKMSDTARTMAGTPGYIAPEVYRAKTDIDAVYTGQADIYSFGICLYRLMNDMLFPFEDTEDTETAHIRRNRGEKLTPPRNASAEFGRIILKACEFSTEERYQDITDMLYDLNHMDRVSSASSVNRDRPADSSMTILAEEAITFKRQEAQPVNDKAASDDSVSDGRTIYFGSYPWSETGEEKPIRWRILAIEDDKALLITEQIIDAMSYSTEDDTFTWDGSGVRRFLNTDFFNSAFEDTEKEIVLPSDLMNYKNVAYRTNSGSRTSDLVYLLSIEEAERFFVSNDERIAKPTPYALKKGIFTENGKAWWWLRTSGNKDSYAADVDYGGDVDSYGSDRYYSVEGIRPVIRVSLNFLENEAVMALSKNVSRNSAYSESMMITAAVPGEIVRYGEYYNESKFTKAPLMWQVLDVKDNKALVITLECIEAMPFDPRGMNLTWRQSDLRRWLNSDFVEMAFGERISSVHETTCVSPPNNVYGVPGAMDTRDKVFLLSLDEAAKYFADDNARIAPAVPYARDKGLFVDSDGGAWWWLRSPGSSQKYAANVDYGGDIDFYGSDESAVNGVRPAMWVDISALRKPH